MRAASAAAWLAVAAAAACCAGRGAALQLLVYPSGEWKVPEDIQHNLTVSLLLEGDEVAQALAGPATAVLEVAALHREAWRLDWQRRAARFSPQEAAEGANKTLTFSGYYWGRTHVGLFLTRDDLCLASPAHREEGSPVRDLQLTWADLNDTLGNLNDTWGDAHPVTNLTLLNDVQIVVDRSAHAFEMAFIGLGSAFLLINNINMGAQLDLGIIRSVLRRPLGPACGFISQFAVMPLITFGLGRLFFTDLLQRLGLFTLGCSPGGIMSNFWTLIFAGDINLSITMTSVSTVAAMGMMPFWMFTLGQELTSGESQVQVPYGNLVVSLISLTVPVGVGVALRWWRPAWAERGSRIIKPFTLVVILFFMSFWFYSSYKVFTMMTWQMVVVGFLVSFLGFSLGASLAKLFCLPKPQIIAISIETAFQNGGVVFILLKLSLPSPDSDLAALPAMAAMLLTGPPMMLIYGLWVLLQRCGYCVVQEPPRQPLDESVEEEEEEERRQEDAEKVDFDRAKEIDAFLFKSDNNIFTDSVMKDCESRYGLVLQGMTTKKLMGATKESSIL